MFLAWPKSISKYIIFGGDNQRLKRFSGIKYYISMCVGDNQTITLFSGDIEYIIMFGGDIRGSHSYQVIKGGPKNLTDQI
jgi:hypothetical protein